MAERRRTLTAIEREELAGIVFGVLEDASEPLSTAQVIERLSGAVGAAIHGLAKEQRVRKIGELAMVRYVAIDPREEPEQ